MRTWKLSSGMVGRRALALLVAVALGASAVVVAPAPASANTDGATSFHFVTAYPDAGTYPPTAGLVANITAFGYNDSAHSAVRFYNETVHLTSSDPAATVQFTPGGVAHTFPVDFTFSCDIPYTIWCTDDYGHTFGVTFRTTGNRSVTLTDADQPSITGTWSTYVQPGAATSLAISNLPATSVQGATTAFKVTVKDALGNVATNYTGTVHTTSSDGAAVLPADRTFTGEDQGVAWLDIRFMTAGVGKTVTVVEPLHPTLSNTKSTTVSIAAHLNFEIQFPEQVFAGYQVGGLFQAMTSANVLDPSYRGTVHFTSSDPNAELPANYTFTAGAAGSDNYILNDVIFHTSGSQTLTATDISNSLITGSVVVDVKGGTVATIAFENLLTSTKAGWSPGFTVVVRDQYGNLAQDIKGVHFTSTDPQAILPADFTFHASDFGRHPFTLELRTAGAQSVTAAIKGYPSITTTQNIAVVANSAAKLAVSGLPATVVSGEANALTVQVRDNYGNPVAAYTGTVHFTSTDGAATLPANYTFAGSDNGAKGFLVTLRTSGSQSVTATDIATGTITGTQTGITVSQTDTNPPSATVTAPASPTKATSLPYGVVFNETVTGLGSDDFTVSGTASGCVVGTPSGSGASYTVAVTGCSEGTVNLSLKAASVTDGAANPGPASLTAASSVVLVDRTAPVITSLHVWPQVGGHLSGTKVPLLVAYIAADDGGSGVVSHTVERSTDGGTTWTTVAAGTTESSQLAYAPSSGRVRFRVSAVDAAGNVATPRSTGDRSPKLIQQSSSTVHWGGAWAGATGAAYSGGSVRYATAAGRSVSYTVTGRSVAFVTTYGPTRGKVKLYVNGTYVFTLDLYRATTTYRAIAWQTTWPTTKTKTIRFVVQGTGGRPRVDADAWVVLR